MKLAAREVRRFLAAPGKPVQSILLYGEDPERVAMARAALVAAYGGTTAADDLRLDRLATAELRKDPSRLIDALKARGFFDGPRVVVLEDAGDTHAALIGEAIAARMPEDAALVVTAGALRAGGALRKLFEGAERGLAVPLYDDPPDAADVLRQCQHAGIEGPPQTVLAALVALARTLGPGEFGQYLTKLAIYRADAKEPLSLGDVEAVAPGTQTGESETLIRAIAEGAVNRVAPEFQRLAGQGETAVGLIGAVGRHFRLLHAGACTGADSAFARVFGPRRDAMLGDVRRWGPEALERALIHLTDTDLALRSSAPGPALAVAERACLRLANLCPHR